MIKTFLGILITFVICIIIAYFLPEPVSTKYFRRKLKKEERAKKEAEELEQAAGLEEKLGMKLVSMRTTQLSDNGTNRTILVYEKVGEPMVSLPRRPGMAQKRPYKA